MLNFEIQSLILRKIHFNNFLVNSRPKIILILLWAILTKYEWLLPSTFFLSLYT